MSHVGVRVVGLAVAAGALWLVTGAGAEADTEIPVRLPYVPAESLPAMQIPGDPSSGVSVRVDPGDNDAPDPAPRLVITIRG